MKFIPSKGLSSDAVWLTVIKLMTTVVGLVVTRLLSEYLSVLEYGTYSQIMLLVATIASITIFGMMDGANFFYARASHSETRDSYVATLFFLQSVLSLVAAAAMMLLMRPICRYFANPSIASLFVFVALLPFLQNLLNMSQALFVAVGKARLLALRNLTVSFLRLLAAAIIATYVQSALAILITSVFLDMVQIAFFWFVLTKSNCHFHVKRINVKLVREILRYCAPMAIYIIINTLNRNIDKYIISAMTDTETLALYTNASKQLPFDILSASFMTVLIPLITRYLSENKKRQAATLYKSFLEISYISTGILCCAALATAPQLMKLLYSNKYTAGLSIFVVYLFSDLIRFTNITLLLSAAGKTRTLMWMGLASLVTNAGLNIILYRYAGVIGPAIATLLVTAVTGIVMLWLNARILSTQLLKFFDWRYLMIFSLESVVLTFALRCLRQCLDKLDVHYFVILVVIAGIYGITMLALHGKRLLEALIVVNNRSGD